MMVLWTILEGCGLGMLHLYHADVQARCVELGLTMPERIRRNSLHFKLCCLPLYLAYTLGSVYAVNGARGFWEGGLAAAGDVVCAESDRPHRD